jgi:hypothetical protein
MTQFSIVIARRSINLSKSYLALSIFFAVFSILFTVIPQQIPTNTGRTAPPFDPTVFFRFLALPFLTFPMLTLTMPVMLLFVYDKNNGVLEYLLSLGKDQGEVFRAYLKASLFLTSIMFIGETALYIPVGLLTGAGLAELTLISALVLALSLSTVSFVTVAMIVFSSLQKQRVGANQPLGTGIGVLLVTPSVFIPIVAASNIEVTELIYALVVIAVGLAALMMTGRLISREKLLP